MYAKYDITKYLMINKVQVLHPFTMHQSRHLVKFMMMMMMMMMMMFFDELMNPCNLDSCLPWFLKWLSES